MSRLPALNPDKTIRIDGVLERKMGLHGGRIIHVPAAIFIEPRLFDDLGGKYINDDFLAYLCVIAINTENIRVISPVTFKEVQAVCYVYSNINGLRLPDTRKKILRYITRPILEGFADQPRKKIRLLK